MPYYATARCKAWEYGGSLPGIVGSNPADSMDICLFCLLSFQVEFCVSGWSLFQRSPTECGVSEEWIRETL
jgi:hypothetical protein